MRGLFVTMQPDGFMYAASADALDGLVAVGVSERYVNRQLARDAAIANGLGDFVTAQVLERVERSVGVLRIEREFRIVHHSYSPSCRTVR